MNTDVIIYRDVRHNTDGALCCVMAHDANGEYLGGKVRFASDPIKWLDEAEAELRDRVQKEMSGGYR